MGNKGAFITLTKDLIPKFTTFSAVVSAIYSRAYISWWASIRDVIVVRVWSVFWLLSEQGSENACGCPKMHVVAQLEGFALVYEKKIYAGLIRGFSPPLSLSLSLHTSPTQLSSQCSMPALCLASCHEDMENNFRFPFLFIFKKCIILFLPEEMYFPFKIGQCNSV